MGDGEQVGSGVREPAQKPVGLDGGTPVWSMSRPDAEGVRGGARLALELVDREVPADGRLGVVFGTNDPSYPFYGPGLRRRLVMLPARDAVREATLAGLRWVVVSPSAGAVPSVPGWRVQTVRGGWQLLTRSATADLVAYTTRR